ncbi:hypothetical protein K443DRAFT_117767, partial [Laccaria amethystina LaAM-08-1]
LKGLKRLEACTFAFWRYCAFSFWWAGKRRDKRDKRRTLPRSRDIPHFLFWACLILLLCKMKGTRETRGARSCIPKIFRIFCCGRRIF